MGFLNNLFGAKEKKISSYADFWEWFSENESTFRKIVKTKDTKTIEEKFFSRLGPKLNELRDGIFYLVGMLNDSTVDLVLTADGSPKNISFVEELVEAAPAIAGWQFTPLKQPMGVGFGLTMNGIIHSQDTLSFYPTDRPDKPDLVDITVFHRDLNDSNKQSIQSGAYILLENYLGELNFLENIDELRFLPPSDAEKDLIPIDALENYLQTRQALFVEKYDGVRIFTENDAYSALEAELESGQKLIAVINTDLLNWNRKASHPWMLVITIGFDGTKNNGMPDSPTFERLQEIEDSICAELRDVDGYLNIGHQTTNGERDIFLACVDFRKPSKVLHEAQQRYGSSFPFDYQIYKDKYWQTVSRFSPSDDVS